MKVSQLIEALQHMPPDVEVVTHANNHTTSDRATMRVALFGSRCVVGNWGTPGGLGRPPPTDIYAVRNYGPTDSRLVIEKYVTKPGVCRYDGTPTIDEYLVTSEEIEEMARADELERLAKEAAERAEFERLRAKFEPGPKVPGVVR